MRNPNGAGCIKKLAGNRRRPYAFAISEHGKQKIIAYFANYSDALECQAQWVRQHDIFSPVRYTDAREMPKFTLVPTFGECFRAWESAHVARGHPYSYSRFTQCWDSLMTRLGMEHKTHDCRHTMASRLDTAGANETARRRILGHAQQTVTEGYTHKSIEELRENVELLA